MALKLPNSAYTISKSKFSFPERSHTFTKPLRSTLKSGESRDTFTLLIPRTVNLKGGHEFLPFNGKKTVEGLRRRGFEITQIMISKNILVHMIRHGVKNGGDLKKSDLKYVVGFSGTSGGKMILQVKTIPKPKKEEKMNNSTP